MRGELLDQVVRAQQQRFGYRDTKRLGGLEIDHQFELGGLLDRKIGGFCTAQDSVDVIGAYLGLFGVRSTVRNQGATLCFVGHGW